MIAYVLAGQGSQKAGMGMDLAQHSPEARKVYEKAAALLGQDLLQLDEVSLRQTRFAQLAIVTLSLACWEAVKSQADPATPSLYGGFSLGEYSMLAAAGILDFADLIDLVERRAQFMQEACEAHPGAMYAVLGLKTKTILSVLNRPDFRDRVWLANDNAPGQIVIAGDDSAAAACAQTLQELNARRIVKLSVGGAFHTPLMQAAADKLQAYAQTLTFRPAQGKVFSNVTGQSLSEDLDFPDYLCRQMVSPVRWVDEVTAMHQAGAQHFIELGPGKVLSGLIRKIVPGARPLASDSPAGLMQVKKALETAPEN